MKTTVMNVLRILDGNATVIINYKGYDRITQKTADTFEVFKPDGRKIIDTFRVVYNENETNVSLNVKIDGTVQLNPNTADRVGLDPIRKVVRFKSYNIIKNGQLADNDFIVRVNKEIFDKLVPLGVIGEYKRYKNLYAIKFDFTDTPIAESKMDDDKLIKTMRTLTTYKIRQKAIAAAIKKTIVTANIYTEEQKTVLEDYGIVNGIYVGVRNQTYAANAEITMRKVQFQLKGATNIPSVNSVLTKVPTKGIGLELYNEFKDYENMTVDKLYQAQKIINGGIDKIKAELAEERIAYTGDSRTITDGIDTVVIKVTDTIREYTQLQA